MAVTAAALSRVRANEGAAARSMKRRTAGTSWIAAGSAVASRLRQRQRSDDHFPLVLQAQRRAGGGQDGHVRARRQEIGHPQRRLGQMFEVVQDQQEPAGAQRAAHDLVG